MQSITRDWSPALMTEAAEREALLEKRLKYIEATLAQLGDEIDKNQTVTLEKIGGCQNAVKELQTLVFGEPKYLLAGLANKVETQNQMLEAMQIEREALRNQIKGMSLLIKILVALVGGGSLAGLGVLLEWLSQ